MQQVAYITIDRGQIKFLPNTYDTRMNANTIEIDGVDLQRLMHGGKRGAARKLVDPQTGTCYWVTWDIADKHKYPDVQTLKLYSDSKCTVPALADINDDNSRLRSRLIDLRKKDTSQETDKRQEFDAERYGFQVDYHGDGFEADHVPSSASRKKMQHIPPSMRMPSKGRSICIKEGEHTNNSPTFGGKGRDYYIPIKPRITGNTISQKHRSIYQNNHGEYGAKLQTIAQNQNHLSENPAREAYDMSQLYSETLGQAALPASFNQGAKVKLFYKEKKQLYFNDEASKLKALGQSIQAIPIAESGARIEMDAKYPEIAIHRDIEYKLSYDSIAKNEEGGDGKKYDQSFYDQRSNRDKLKKLGALRREVYRGNVKDGTFRLNVDAMSYAGNPLNTADSSDYGLVYYNAKSNFGPDGLLKPEAERKKAFEKTDRKFIKEIKKIVER